MGTEGANRTRCHSRIAILVALIVAGLSAGHLRADDDRLSWDDILKGAEPYQPKVDPSQVKMPGSSQPPAQQTGPSTSKPSPKIGAQGPEPKIKYVHGDPKLADMVNPGVKHAKMPDGVPGAGDVVKQTSSRPRYRPGLHDKSATRLVSQTPTSVKQPGAKPYEVGLSDKTPTRIHGQTPTSVKQVGAKPYEAGLSDKTPTQIHGQTPTSVKQPGGPKPYEAGLSDKTPTGAHRQPGAAQLSEGGASGASAGQAEGQAALARRPGGGPIASQPKPRQPKMLTGRKQSFAETQPKRSLAGQVIEGAMVAGMIADPAVSEAQRALETGEDYNAGRVVKNVTVAIPMYEQGGRRWQEERAKWAAGQQSKVEAGAKAAFKATAVDVLAWPVKDSIPKRFNEMWDQAEAEGRQATRGEVLWTVAKVSYDGVRKIDPFNPLYRAYHNMQTFDQLADYGEQKVRMKAFVDNRMTTEARQLGELERKIQKLTNEGNPKDPAQAAQLATALSEYSARYERLRDIAGMAQKTHVQDPAALQNMQKNLSKVLHPNSLRTNAEDLFAARGGQMPDTAKGVEEWMAKLNAKISDPNTPPDQKLQAQLERKQLIDQLVKWNARTQAEKGPATAAEARPDTSGTPKVTPPTEPGKKPPQDKPWRFGEIEEENQFWQGVVDDKDKICIIHPMGGVVVMTQNQFRERLMKQALEKGWSLDEVEAKIKDMGVMNKAIKEALEERLGGNTGVDLAKLGKMKSPLDLDKGAEPEAKADGAKSSLDPDVAKVEDAEAPPDDEEGDGSDDDDIEWYFDDEDDDDQDEELRDANAKLRDAGHAGDGKRREAKKIVDEAGGDAQDTADEATAKAIEAQRDDSIGHMGASIVETSLVAGARGFGKGLGKGAADKANRDLYGKGGDRDEDGGEADEDDEEKDKDTPTLAGTKKKSSSDKDDEKDKSCKKTSSKKSSGKTKKKKSGKKRKGHTHDASGRDVY